MEHYEWMNEQVRQEIEDLQRTYGFDEDEALAYWHLRHAGILGMAGQADLVLGRDRDDALEVAESTSPLLVGAAGAGLDEHVAAVDPDDVESLQDLVVAAFRDADGTLTTRSATCWRSGRSCSFPSSAGPRPSSSAAASHSPSRSGPAAM